MKSLILIGFLTFFSSCRLFEVSENTPCPYKVKYTGHNPLIPLTIHPQKINYNIGDTIHISTQFKDSVYDFSTEETFLMKNFPFDPGVKLWRFENDSTWENGFRVNDYTIDSIYFQRFDANDDYVGVLYVDFVEKENKYFFEMDIVLKKKGRYIFQFEDYIHRYPSEYYDEKIKPYTFEGQCNLGIRPVAMIQGDDHLTDFVSELVHIDKKIFYDFYTSLKFKNIYDSPYGSGDWPWEFIGSYGFEVK
ncbi:MAG: hypothetical protein IPF52_10270 [Saprospiraceae bacterium]|nr:hypothetical protein [Saprospiraceae bacterium]